MATDSRGEVPFDSLLSDDKRNVKTSGFGPPIDCSWRAK